MQVAKLGSSLKLVRNMSSTLRFPAASVETRCSFQECEQHLNEAQGLFREAQHWRGEARHRQVEASNHEVSGPRGHKTWHVLIQPDHWRWTARTLPSIILRACHVLEGRRVGTAPPAADSGELAASSQALEHLCEPDYLQRCCGNSG